MTNNKNMYHFYSQQGEDIYVFYNYINIPNKDAVFVELGGLDGVRYSNSKFFEDTLNFNGVLIEPTHNFHNMKKNRPNCKSYNSAVTYENKMVYMVGNCARAGLMDSIDLNTHKYLKNLTPYLVKGEKFSDILKNSNINRIDFLTIDVEGGELAVLETMDFGIPVYVVVLETHEGQASTSCRKILQENGFVFDRHFCLNDVWYNPNYPYVTSVYEPREMPEFNELSDLGTFHFMEKHLILEISSALRSGKRKFL
jgi:FkbM family methyltransferase